MDLPAQRAPLDVGTLTARTHERRPILPGRARNREGFVALLAWLGRYGAHATAFHGARSPLYVARLIARSPRGAWVVARSVFGWVLDREQAPIREGVIQRGAVAEYMALSKQR